MITINATVTDAASPMIRTLISSLSGREIIGLNEVGGRAATEAARKYHHAFDRRGGWKGNRYMSNPAGSSSFGSDVAAGWFFVVADQTGALIANDAQHFGFKVRGGTIRPKRVSALTIPLIPEAKGLRAAVYVQNTGRRLFTIRGKNALFERVEGMTYGARGRRGAAGATAIRQSGIRAVYALVKSVTQAPWKDALPDDDIITGAFTKAWRDDLIRRIENA